MREIARRNSASEAKTDDIYEYVCLLARSVVEKMPEALHAGDNRKNSSSLVCGLASTIIRRTVEEVDRTGTSPLLASLIRGDTICPAIWKEKGRYLNKEELVERGVRDLKDRKHSVLLEGIFREILADFIADITSDVCAMEPYRGKKKHIPEGSRLP